MRYFITGASGFIGGAIVRQLREAGHAVTALVRPTSNTTALKDLGVDLAEGDITDKDSLREPMHGADGVFHLAAWYVISGRNGHQAEVTNVDGTRNVLEVMRELGIPRGVYTSTLGIFGDTHGELKNETYVYRGKHESRYAETKWRAHHQVAMPMMREGLPLMIVQPGVVYGPADHSNFGQSLRLWLRGLLPLIPAMAAYCFSHINDCARGCIQAMDKGQPGQTYIIGGPAYRMVEVMQLAHTITGRPAPLITAGPGLMRLNAVIMDALGAVIPLPDPFSGESLRYSARATNLGTSARAERELGFTTRPLADGLRETLEYEIAHLKDKR